MSKERDRVALLIASVVAVFVVGSLAIILVLIFTGVAPGDNIWAGLFSMMTALLGALGGYFTGIASEARRTVGKPPCPPED